MIYIFLLKYEKDTIDCKVLQMCLVEISMWCTENYLNLNLDKSSDQFNAIQVKLSSNLS